MKKLLFLGAAALILAACASSTSNTTTATNAQGTPVTAASIYQESQDLRAKVNDAKTTYQTAKTVNQATGGAAAATVTQTVKDAVNNATNGAATNAQSEYDAWKQALSF